MGQAVAGWRDLWAAGLHVVAAVPGTKRPAAEWRRWQDERPPAPREDLGTAGIVTGAAGVEAIDFDAAGLLLPAYLASLEDADAGLANALYVERSPSGGAHIVYRCPAPEGNQVLADVVEPARPGRTMIERGGPELALRVDAAASEYLLGASSKTYRVAAGHCVIRAIETRGVGGYLVTAPSPGYVPLQGSLAELPMLAQAQRDLLLQLARQLHERRPEAAEPEPATPPAQRPAPHRQAEGNAMAERPGDDYAQRGDHQALLLKHGWELISVAGDNEHWQRPGGEAGKVGATWSIGRRVLYAFTTSTELPAETGLSLFQARAILEHGGDHSACAAALVAEGYGQPRPRQDRTAPPLLAASLPPGGQGGTDGEAAPPARWEYELNETGNAERFLDLYGSSTLYCHTWGHWLIWTGTHWRRDDTEQVDRYMREAIDRSCQRQIGIYGDRGLQRLADNVAKWRLKNLNDRAIRNSLSRAAKLEGLAVRATQLDADPWAFSCATGTIDLRTGELRAHDPEDLITRCSDADYDAGASDPRWAAFLDSLTGGSLDLQQYLQRAAGYSMSGSTREQALFLVHGPGGTGKSTFVAAISAIIGSYADTVPFEIFLRNNNKKSWTLAKISQARLVVCEESAAGRAFADDTLKLLTGGTPIEAEAKFAQPFTYLPQFKVWLVTNTLPRTSDQDEGVWRRVQCIECPHKPTTRDKDLAHHLTNDRQARAAVLAWMVAGAVDYHRHDGLAAPAAVLEAIKAYREDQNPILGWWQERVAIDHAAQISRTDLRQDYEAWCRANGHKPIGARGFTERVRNMGNAGECTVTKVCGEGAIGGRRGWQGIRLRLDDDFEDDGRFPL